MEFDTNPVSQDPSPLQSFLQAKIELYLERAAECFSSGRYRAALRALDGVWRLDPANAEASALHILLEEKIRLLSRASDGNAAGSGHGQGSRRSEVVLVVDQDPRVRTGLMQSLHGYGFRCIGAESFDEGVETFQEYQPAIVLSEVNFADGPRGFDLFQEVKSSRATENLVFIFMVSSVEREVEIAGRKLGVDDFLRKPFDSEIVATMIMRSLHKLPQAVGRTALP